MAWASHASGLRRFVLMRPTTMFSGVVSPEIVRVCGRIAEASGVQAGWAGRCNRRRSLRCLFQAASVEQPPGRVRRRIQSGERDGRERVGGSIRCRVVSFVAVCVVRFERGLNRCGVRGVVDGGHLRAKLFEVGFDPAFSISVWLSTLQPNPPHSLECLRCRHADGGGTAGVFSTPPFTAPSASASMTSWPAITRWECARSERRSR